MITLYKYTKNVWNTPLKMLSMDVTVSEILLKTHLKFVILSTNVAAWQMKKMTNDKRLLKHNKPLQHVAFDLNINTWVLLYLCFALIRQKIFKQVSYNVHALKTVPHYILLVTTLEFLLIHWCKWILFPKAPNVCLPTL